MNFDEAFTKLLGHEGGYSNHPADKGGETMWGITIAVARAEGYKGAMRNMPVDFAKGVYKRSYWDAVQADKLPAKARYAVFDAAVNSGVSRAKKWLQQALGVAQDGQIGAKTLAAAAAIDGGVLLARYMGIRLEFMASLSTWSSFGKGWARRVASLLQDA